MKAEHVVLDKSTERSMPVHPFFDEAAMRACLSDFMWCIHCERAYRYGEPRERDGKLACPYVGCENTRAEPWDWQRVRRLNPDYPPQPTHAVVYPLFGRGTYVRG